MVGLYHETTGKLDHKRFAWARKVGASEKFLDINGIEIDANTVLAGILGLSDGIQY